jgi:hypothetical protein
MPTSTPQPTGETADRGDFPKPGDFKVESQVDRNVGIQADMKVKPEGATVQEGEDSYDNYKPAGKVSPLSLKTRIVDSLFEQRESC